MFTSGRYKKSLHQEAFWRCFPFHLSRASLLMSGAKVKEEAENSSIHACVTLCGKEPNALLKRVAQKLSTF
ncbi:hypothetical protein CIW55_14235 [Enterobacter cloacae]|nr:hypothetical protein CIW55_14235 [Enterobacter cloacae]PAO14154.1 hypothetical protein CIW58_11990 [Enterobacter cloacae]